MFSVSNNLQIIQF